MFSLFTLSCFIPFVSMIIRVGVDIVSIERVERALVRWGDRFLTRVFTAREREACRGRVESLAARFAAKEAVLKALGCGLDEGITWQDVEIQGRGTAPRIHLQGEALARAHALGIRAWSISLSHEAGLAVAVAVGYGESGAS